MIVDSSALLSILFDEDDAAWFVGAFARAGRRLMSAANYVEVGIRLTRSSTRPTPVRLFETFVRESGIDIRSVSADQARIAVAAYRDYGRGSRSLAQLNYGDCFAYALAKETGLPLLFKGNDFTHTDIKPVAG